MLGVAPVLLKKLGGAAEPLPRDGCPCYGKQKLLALVRWCASALSRTVWSIEEAWEYVGCSSQNRKGLRLQKIAPALPGLWCGTLSFSPSRLYACKAKSTRHETLSKTQRQNRARPSQASA